MNNQLLSVIIPTYNAAEYLQEAVESIITQTYSPLEIIVVDDGSIDNTKEILRSFPSVRYFYQENMGPAAARNLGIQNSTGNYIAFHDADDISLPKRLELQMQLLLSYLYLGFCITRIQNFVQPNKTVMPELVTEDLLKPRMGFVSSAVVRKEALNKIGYFDVSYRHAEDVEWMQRAQQKEVPYAVITDVLISRRIHDQNLSMQINQGHENLMKLLRSSAKSR